MIKNDARSIHPGECMLHLWEATQHSAVLCTVTGSTLAYSFARIRFLLPHPDVASPSIRSLLLPCLWYPILLLFDFYTSASIYLIPSGSCSSFSSLTFPRTHFQFFPKKLHFLLSFPHICLIFTVLSYCHLCKSPMNTLPLPQPNTFS